MLRFLGARLANEQDAQDLAQEAYLRLLRASNSRVIHDPVAYVLRIARNLLHEWYSSPSRSREPAEGIELVDEGMSVEDWTEISQQMERLEKFAGRAHGEGVKVPLRHLILAKVPRGDSHASPRRHDLR